LQHCALQRIHDKMKVMHMRQRKRQRKPQQEEQQEK
jgi:hypothetical protein